MSETLNANEELKKSEVIKAEDGCESSETPEKTPKKATRDEYKGQITPVEPPPEKMELAGWYIFSFSSYFVHVFLIPVLFPLMITQRAWPTTDLPDPSSLFTARGVKCSLQETALYQRLIYHSITVDDSKFSPLHWTTVSWAAGIVIAVPVLVLIAHRLDHGNNQPVIIVGAIIAGAFSCLLTGFFKTNWLFPVYIVAIAMASIVGAAAHIRHFGFMVRGLTGEATGQRRFSSRRAFGSWLSLHSTAAGSLGAALISVFAYHMLRRKDQLTSLWVVSIFSGLLWLAGIAHAAFSSRPERSTWSSPPISLTKYAHVLAVFGYPHAIGGLAAVFLSSFACMCIFTSGTLYIIGDLCIEPLILLFLWIIYFTFPVVSLPVLHPLQLVVRADAVRMQLLGFFASAFTSGLGFYNKDETWRQAHIILATLLQSTANGVLHAFGRALLVDCSPAGKEGAFGAWFAWARAAGGCAGFAVGTASPGNIKTTFAAAFLASFLGVFVLIFGNVSNAGGMVAAAGHGKEEDDRGERSAVLASQLA